MKITNRMANIMVVAFIAIIILLVSMNVNAECSKTYCPPEVHHDHHDVIDGKDGKDGINGIDAVGIQGATGRAGRDAPYALRNLNLSRSIAVAASLGQIPALSHVGTHNHTGMGIGAANYNGENAMAIGLLHQEENRSYKATIGVSGSERIVGGGASWAFK